MPRIDDKCWRFAALLAVAGCLATAVQPALGQSWWPFGGADRPPAPPEPVYREPPRRAPPPRTQDFGQSWTTSRPPICLQLEQRLAMEANRGSNTREQLPRIENEMRALERTLQGSQDRLERSDCYDFFLFAKSLKRTRACVNLSNRVDDAKRRMAELDAQRQQLLQSTGRSMQEELVYELARNNCGPGYQQQARSSNPFSSTFWQDQEGIGQGGNRFGTLPFATYRTICVRLCDGYYFPVSFSTLPNHFDRDADVCQQKCAAPAELYFHQNPGGAVDQALSHKSQQPYTSLKSAFRYRKEFVAGCSCKQAEYVPQGTSPAGASGKRADAGGWRRTTVQPER